jgi:hypothetical protein
MVVHPYHPSYMSVIGRRIVVQAWSKPIPEKQLKQKWLGDTVQVVECRLSKCNVLSSNPTLPKNLDMKTRFP